MLYRQEGKKRIRLTPDEEAEVRAEWASNDAAQKVEQDRQRRMALARAHAHKRRYTLAARDTGEDYTDLIAETDKKIAEHRRVPKAR